MGVGCWVMMACWGVGVLGDDGLLGCWVLGDGCWVMGVEGLELINT